MIMLRRQILVFLAIITFVSTSGAQSIVYSQPDKDDQKTENFDIIGKIDGHYLIYKNLRSKSSVTVLDDRMQLIEKISLDFVPEKLIATDLLTYREYFYFFYQYQRKNVVYCMVAKLNGDGKVVGEPKELDTTNVNYFANSRIYNVLNSEDKQKIMVFKINSKHNDNYVLTTSLFNNDLQLIARSAIRIPMPAKEDFLTEFSLDNDGGLVFLRPSGTSDNDNITELTLVTKAPLADSLGYYNLGPLKLFLDDPKIKVDNINKNYLVISFYSKQKRGNIDGLYTLIWDKTEAKTLYNTNTTFSDEIRDEAKSDGSLKFAFNNFFLQNIVVKKDGGFAMAAEAVYSSNRGNNYNRWDYMYRSPYMTPSDYYYFSSPYYNSYYYPWGRWGSPGYQITRYYADNVAILSFDSTATLMWTNVIHKSQYDDFTDNFIGYGTYNSGTKYHFLFNELERRSLLLSDQSITPDGHLERSPTLHNLDKEYQFMPRYAKQVSSRELIVPCQYRNFTCFAKIEF